MGKCVSGATLIPTSHDEQSFLTRNTQAPMPDVVITPSSTNSTSYTVSPPPAAVFQAPMRILKRPSSNSPSSSAMNVSNSTRETLAEREARYQAARERIFKDDISQNSPDEGVKAPSPPNESSRSPKIAQKTNVVRSPRGPESTTAGSPAAGFGARQKRNPPGSSPSIQPSTDSALSA
jgi:SUZ domain